MSYSKLVYIYCDFCYNTEPHSIGPMPDAGVEEERALNAGPLGWTFPRINHRAYDRCPDCTEAKARTPKS